MSLRAAYDDGQGGYVEVPLVCEACGGDVELLEGSRPDGTRVSELRCPCLRTSMIRLDMGRLELGVVREAFAATEEYEVDA